MATWGDHRWRSWGVEAIWRSIARHEVHHPSPRVVAWGIRPAGLGRKPANFQNWLLHAGNRKKGVKRTAAGIWLSRQTFVGGQSSGPFGTSGGVLCSPQFYVQFLLRPVMEASTINCGYSTHFQTDLKCRRIMYSVGELIVSPWIPMKSHQIFIWLVVSNIVYFP